MYTVLTSLEWTHPALGAAFGPGNKIEGGWDFVGDGICTVYPSHET